MLHSTEIYLLLTHGYGITLRTRHTQNVKGKKLLYDGSSYESSPICLRLCLNKIISAGFADGLAQLADGLAQYIWAPFLLNEIMYQYNRVVCCRDRSKRYGLC